MTVLIFFLRRDNDADNNALFENLRSIAQNFGPISAFLAVEKAALKESLQHALERAQKEKVNLVLFDSSETLYVSTADLAQFFSTCLKEELSLYFADNGLLWSKAHVGQILNMLTSSLEVDSRLRSERVKGSLKALKARGLRLGGKRFGDRPEDRRIVQQVLGLHKDGLSLQKICSMLALSDIKTVQNKKWHPTTVKRIIERFS